MNFILNNKLFFLIIFLILENNLIQSQDTDIIGFRSGITFSNQNWAGKDVPSFSGEYKTGLVYGIYYSHQFFHNFILQSEFNYLQEGSNMPSSWGEYYIDNGTKKNAKYSLDYLSFLALSKFIFHTHKVFPYIEIGPRFDILYQYSMLGFEQPYPLDQFDYGYSIGCGAEFLILKHLQTNLEVRYNKGLNKIWSFATTADAISVQNHSFEITLGVGIK